MTLPGPGIGHRIGHHRGHADHSQGRFHRPPALAMDVLVEGDNFPEFAKRWWAQTRLASDPSGSGMSAWPADRPASWNFSGEREAKSPETAFCSSLRTLMAK